MRRHGKIKKQPGHWLHPALSLVPNPDILATLSAKGPDRPRLVVGFAAETDDLLDNAGAKLARKGCDWIVANDVSPETGIMGGSGERGSSGHRRGDRALAATAPRRLLPAKLADRIAQALA